MRHTFTAYVYVFLLLYLIIYYFVLYVDSGGWFGIVVTMLVTSAKF